MGRGWCGDYERRRMRRRDWVVCWDVWVVLVGVELLGLVLMVLLVRSLSWLIWTHFLSFVHWTVLNFELSLALAVAAAFAAPAPNVLC